MSLPKIENTTPVVVPAGEEKVYPDIHLTRITIDTPPPGVDREGNPVQRPWTVDVRYVPYNYATGEALQPSPTNRVGGTLRISDLRAEAEKDVDVAGVIGGLLNVVSKKLAAQK